VLLERPPAGDNPRLLVDWSPSAVAGDIDETRLLVDWHHVGAIIGKSGASVKRLREESGCAINIIAPAANAPSPQQIDRIMTVKAGSSRSRDRAVQAWPARLLHRPEASLTVGPVR
jgi:hypothetical protein